MGMDRRLRVCWLVLIQVFVGLIYCGRDGLRIIRSVEVLRMLLDEGHWYSSLSHMFRWLFLSLGTGDRQIRLLPANLPYKVYSWLSIMAYVEKWGPARWLTAGYLPGASRADKHANFIDKDSTTTSTSIWFLLATWILDDEIQLERARAPGKKLSEHSQISIQLQTAVAARYVP